MSDHVHGPECAHNQTQGTPVKLGAVGGKEPCPCGSGKRYKHCCYRPASARENRAEMIDVARVESPPAVEASSEEIAAAPGRPSAGTGSKSDDPGPKVNAPDPRGRVTPKGPVIARSAAIPPRKPPQGANKALSRRSGHR